MLYKFRMAVAILILIMAIIGFTGIFYYIPIFNLQFTPVVQRFFTDFSIIAAVIFLTTILYSLIFGRIYCSLICPFGIFQELISLITKKNNETQHSYPLKYFIAALSFGVLIGGSAIIIRYIDPYTLFGSALTFSLIGITAVIAIILIVIFKNRFFCTNICPVGTILGLLSKISLFKIYINKQDCLSCGTCERNCPSGCIDSEQETVNNETCIKCLKCITECPKNAIKYGIKPKETIKFNPKRRALIISSAALILFASAVKAGKVLALNSAKKIKNIILPPGSINEERMLNKCLNCNLCINACPNKIIKKANNEYGAVHINYSDKGVCKFDCNECSKVCPSGAIKKISLEEKQKTRIAIAVINKDKCISCGACVFNCPVKAISKNTNEPAIIDASKCIGCGACKAKCHFDAIEIFAVNEQKVI